MVKRMLEEVRLAHFDNSVKPDLTRDIDSNVEITVHCSISVVKRTPLFPGG